MLIFYHIGNCAQNVRIFAYEIKVFLFVPQDWGTEGVEVLKILFYLNYLPKIFTSCICAGYVLVSEFLGFAFTTVNLTYLP